MFAVLSSRGEGAVEHSNLKSVNHHSMASEVPTDEEAWRWVAQQGYEDLRGTSLLDLTVWHWAAMHGRADICRWLEAQGVSDGKNATDDRGRTPLHYLVAIDCDTLPDRFPAYEETALWMIANGADVKTVDMQQRTVFAYACTYMSFAVARELADKVPPEHLTMPGENGFTPIKLAFSYTKRDAMPITQMLILRGVPVLLQDFFLRQSVPYDLDKLIKQRNLANQLASWAMSEVATRDTFLALVLGCGIHGSRDVAPAQRSQLLNLRGDGNTDVRMRIAGYLGVRLGEEAGRLRRAANVLGEVVVHYRGFGPLVLGEG